MYLVLCAFLTSNFFKEVKHCKSVTILWSEMMCFGLTDCSVVIFSMLQ